MFAKVLPLIISALADGKLSKEEVIEIILAILGLKKT